MGVILLLNREDSLGFTTRYRYEVKTKWFKNRLEDEGDYDSVDEFLEEYNSDDSMAVYESALLEDAVMGLEKLETATVLTMETGADYFPSVVFRTTEVPWCHDSTWLMALNIADGSDGLSKLPCRKAKAAMRVWLEDFAQRVRERTLARNEWPALKDFEEVFADMEKTISWWAKADSIFDEEDDDLGF